MRRSGIVVVLLTAVTARLAGQVDTARPAARADSARPAARPEAVSSAARADTTWLTLYDCVHMARERGPLGAMARSSMEGKEATYRSFMRGFFPQLALQGDVPGYTHSINPVVLPDGTTMF
ncbi:MAG TPA: hypothetical protein VMM80_12150, partial [Bacteroidota bacterium]|nr:hypothetical protein [Bacteroidota bacterium]